MHPRSLSRQTHQSHRSSARMLQCPLLYLCWSLGSSEPPDPYKNIYAEDNKTVYRHIVKETLSMKYAAMIAPFKRAGNGMGAYLSLKPQFTGPARWDQDIKSTMNLMVNQKWTGNTGFSLQAFLNQHCESYTMIQCYTEYFQHQLPDTRQILKWILNKFDFEDSDVRAELSSIGMDDATNDRRNNF